MSPLVPPKHTTILPKTPRDPLLAEARKALAEYELMAAQQWPGPITQRLAIVLREVVSALTPTPVDPTDTNAGTPTEGAPDFDLQSEVPSERAALATEIDNRNMEDRSWMIDALERAADLLREDRRVGAGRPAPKLTTLPVVDAIAAGRKPLIIDDHVIGVPLTDEATNALHEWIGNNLDGLAEALAPHGLHPDDIQKPAYTRVVYEDDTITFPEAIGRFMQIPDPQRTTTALAVCPECRDGKHKNCTGQALDRNDEWVECSC